MKAKDYGLTNHPTCSVCSHKQVEMIHRALARGENQKAVAEKYGLTYNMVHGHIIKGHLGELVEIAQRDGRIARLADLMDATRATAEETLEILRGESDKRCYSCGRGGDSDVKLRAIDRLHNSIKLAGQITGQISSNSVTNFLVQIGARDEAELRTALSQYRSGQEVKLEDTFEDALQLILITIRKHPELQQIALDKIGAQVTTTGRENGHTESLSAGS